MEQKQPDLENWNDFSGKFLKADLIDVWPALFIPISVKSNYDEEDNAHIVYTGEYQGKKKEFEPNKTNLALIRKFGVKSPKALIGKKVYFEKVMNRNPTTKALVPSLQIAKIE